METCSSSKIGVYVLHVGLDLVSKLVETFEGGLAMDWIDVCLLEEVVFVTDRDRHGG